MATLSVRLQFFFIYLLNTWIRFYAIKIKIWPFSYLSVEQVLKHKTFYVDNWHSSSCNKPRLSYNNEINVVQGIFSSFNFHAASEVGWCMYNTDSPYKWLMRWVIMMILATIYTIELYKKENRADVAFSYKILVFTA